MPESHDHRLLHPYEKASLLSKAFFTWMLPVLWRGFKEQVDITDIPTTIPDREETLHTGASLEKQWLREITRAKDSPSKGPPKLFSALLRNHAKHIIITSVVSTFCDVVIKTWQAVSLGQMIFYSSRLLMNGGGQLETVKDITTNESINNSQIARPQITSYDLMSDRWSFSEPLVQWTLSLMMATLVFPILIHNYCFEMMRLGIQIRVSCSYLIYKKAVRLSHAALAQSTIGQMVNLLSNDVDRFDLVVIFIPFMWIAPIQVSVTMVILWAIIGSTSLTLLLILFLFMGIQSYLSQKFSYYRTTIANLTDVRSRYINEVISAIRVVKTYAWESHWHDKITKARYNEMQAIRDVSFYRAINQAVGFFSSKIIVFSVLATAVITSQADKGVMNPWHVFLIISLLNNVQATISRLLPQTISFWSEMMVSIKRIEEFLLLEERIPSASLEFFPLSEEQKINLAEVRAQVEEAIKREERSPVGSLTTSRLLAAKSIREQLDQQHRELIESNREQTVRIRCDRVNASWTEMETTPSLVDLSFDLHQNELLIVCGPVASGKSSLLLAVLGECPLFNGSIRVWGKLGYTSQQPWIFAGTVRDNILFGEPFEAKRYARVVTVCALKRDLQLLENGDQTYISDKGTSLSGGQKTRINLARCLYRDSDCYLLDDPLSAVDSNVSEHLFFQAIKGFLKYKSVILVTHHVEYLKHADNILLLNHGRALAYGNFKEIRKHGIDFLDLSQALIHDKSPIIPMGTTNQKAGQPLIQSAHPPKPSPLVQPQVHPSNKPQLSSQALPSNILNAIDGKTLSGTDGTITGSSNQVATTGASSKEITDATIKTPLPGKSTMTGSIEPDASQMEQLTSKKSILSDQELNLNITIEQQMDRKDKLESERMAALNPQNDHVLAGAKEQTGATLPSPVDQVVAKAAMTVLQQQQQQQQQQQIEQPIGGGIPNGESKSIGLGKQTSSPEQQRKLPEGNSTVVAPTGSVVANANAVVGSPTRKAITEGTPEALAQKSKPSEATSGGKISSSLPSTPLSGSTAGFSPSSQPIQSSMVHGGKNTWTRTSTNTSANSSPRSSFKKSPKEIKEELKESNRQRTEAMTEYLALPVVGVTNGPTSRSMSLTGGINTGERLHTGSVKLHVWLKYLTVGSKLLFVLTVIGFLMSQIFYTSIDGYLSVWTNIEQQRLTNNFTDSSVNQNYRWLYHMVFPLTRSQHIITYMTLIIILTIFSLLKNLAFFGAANRSADYFHAKLLKGAIYAQMSYFDKNPIGVILNRATRDMGVIDEILPVALFTATEILLQLLATLCLISSVDYYLAIPSLLLLAIILCFHRFFVGASRDLKRLENVARSPIFSHLASTLEGLATIRACKHEGAVEEQYINYQNEHTSIFFYYIGARRWLAITLDSLNALYIAGLCIWCISYIADGSAIGLMISSAILMCGLMQFGFFKLAETEAFMTSVERVMECIDLKQEENYDQDNDFGIAADDQDDDQSDGDDLNIVDLMKAGQKDGTGLSRIASYTNLSTALTPKSQSKARDNGGFNKQQQQQVAGGGAIEKSLGTTRSTLQTGLKAKGQSATSFCLTKRGTKLMMGNKLLQGQSGSTSTAKHQPPRQLRWITNVENKKIRLSEWPQLGNLQFNKVTLAYNRDEKPVLHDVTFAVQSGERVGIVGRTGAGKTSIITTLFRLYNYTGQIIIDSVDTKKLALRRLREKLSIIPQDPVIFTGSFRSNVDPFDQYTDEQIWKALNQVHLKETVSRMPHGLASHLSEGGNNLSAGQKQLVCLARTLLKNNKILVLDEATANVDHETDALIQDAMRTQFVGCTVLTIAHRLNTIIDYDKVLVMDGGRVEEYAEPFVLLQKPNGIFTQMVSITGKRSAAHLKSLAKTAYESRHGHMMTDETLSTNEGIRSLSELAPQPVGTTTETTNPTTATTTTITATTTTPTTTTTTPTTTTTTTNTNTMNINPQ